VDVWLDTHTPHTHTLQAMCGMSGGGGAVPCAPWSGP
jgi:hypothetical protein